MPSDTDSSTSSMPSSSRMYLRWSSFDQKRNLAEASAPNPGPDHEASDTSIGELDTDETLITSRPPEGSDSLPGLSAHELSDKFRSSVSIDESSKPCGSFPVIKKAASSVVPLSPATPFPSKAMASRGTRSHAGFHDESFAHATEEQTRVRGRTMRTADRDGFRSCQSTGLQRSLPSGRSNGNDSHLGQSQLSSSEEYADVDLTHADEAKEIPVLELPDFRKRCPTPLGNAHSGQLAASSPFKSQIKVKEVQVPVKSTGGGYPSKSDCAQGDQSTAQSDAVSQQRSKEISRSQSGGANALLYGCGMASSARSKSQANLNLNSKKGLAPSPGSSYSFSYSFAPGFGNSSHCSSSSSYSSHASSPGGQWHSPTSTKIRSQLSTTLMDLPDECLVKIISKFDSVKDWLSSTRVCRRWAVLANDGLSALRLNDNVNYSGRGGVFTLLHRFPNLTFLQVPASVCTNSFCANLKTSCPGLLSLTLAACSPTGVPRTPGSKLEPQALPPAIGTLSTLRELRVQSDLVAGFPGSVGLLSNLEVLELGVCRRIKSLPDSLGELKALKTLSLVEVRGLLTIPESLGLLWNLRTLKISLCSSLTSVPSSIGKLSALEYVEISGCDRMTHLPGSFCALTSLQTIKLLGFKVLQRHSGSKRGEAAEDNKRCGQHFPFLRRLELGWTDGGFPLSSQHAPALQNASVLPLLLGPTSRLNVLEFKHCRELSHIPPSVFEIRCLEQFSLVNCPALQAIPDSLGSWSSLRHLEVSKCVHLADIPSSVGLLHALNSMILKDVHRLELLPKSIGNLKSLRQLQLLHCPRLVCLPSSFGHLSHLEALEIWRCSSLVVLPHSFSQLSSLQKLRIINCQSLETLPEDFGNLRNLSLLEVVDCGQLSELPDTFGGLTSLTSLTLRLRGLEALPNSFGQLNSLKSLVLAGVGSLLCLPSTFGYLSSLKSLEIESGDRIVTLPESFGRLESLALLKMQWCDSLMVLPESFGQLTSLTSLELTDCRQLESLPLSIGDLRSLETLRIRECASLSSLPPSFGDLSSLQSLALRGTPISSLPNSFGHLSALQHLTIHSTPLTTLPETFGHLICLYDLRLEHCPLLSCLPKTFGGLVSLHSVQLLALPSLSDLPRSFGDLSGLRQVDIQDAGVTSLECLGELKTLTKVEIRGCVNLPESWGNMGRWMQRLPSTRLAITFSPPKEEKKGKLTGRTSLRGDRTSADSDKQCAIM